MDIPRQQPAISHIKNTFQCHVYVLEGPDVLIQGDRIEQ